jgi:hypothetical protein
MAVKVIVKLVKVKQSLFGSGQALRNPETEVLRFQDGKHINVEGQPYAPATFTPTPRNIPGTLLYYSSSQPQDHIAAERIMSPKNYIDAIGNRTLYLQAVARCLNQLRYPKYGST